MVEGWLGAPLDMVEGGLGAPLDIVEGGLGAPLDRDLLRSPWIEIPLDPLG